MKLLLCSVVAILALAVPSLRAFEAAGTLQEIDAANGVVKLHANGQDRTVPLAANVQVLGTNGMPLAEGIQSPLLKAGTEITVVVDRGATGPAIGTIRLGHQAGGNAGGSALGKTSVGFKPLTEMTAADHYKGEDGGLYGGGLNEPPPALQAAAARATARIVPLDAAGNPDTNGVIGLVSISMSNATMEYSRFKELADHDARKSPRVAIVDCAQGGKAMAQWTDPQAGPWLEADRRLAHAGVSPRQVQVIWVKLANVQPTGTLTVHARKLERDTQQLLQNAKARFPNLRIAYLGSRIYAGYANTPLNPEPYAYEGAFAARWLIQDQLRADSEAAYDETKGEAKVPLALWGPYFWADGLTPRQADHLVWERQDLAGDGTHPSPSGREKVAGMLLEFFATDPLARTWFMKP